MKEKLIKERDTYRAQRDRLLETLTKLLAACDEADLNEELSGYIDGSLLDKARDTITEVEEGR